MFTARDANAFVHGMLQDVYFDKERLLSYLNQCKAAENEDFGDVVNGLSKESLLSPLHISIKRCLPEVVEIFIQFGARLESRDSNGITPLLMACATGSLRAVHLLCAAGADLKAVDAAGLSCAHHAAKSGYTHILHYLHFVRGVDLASRDHRCNSLLHVAVTNKHSNTMRYLLKHQRDLLQVVNFEGNTALHEACKEGNGFLVCEFLRTENTELVHRTNNNGQTPMDLALSSHALKKTDIHRQLSALSNLRRVKMWAYVCWVFQLLLPGLSLFVAPASYMCLPFPVNYIVPLVVVAFGFFRPTTQHRISNGVYNWPNPALLGAVLSGYIHTFVCCLVYFLSSWSLMFWWIILLFGLSLVVFHTFWKLHVTDPGVTKVGKLNQAGVPMTILDVAENYKREEFCLNCEIVLPEKTKHCKLCDSCCTGFDHHCMWLMRCVGHGNHRRFVAFCFLMGLDNFVFSLAACYYLVMTSAKFELDSIWSKASTQDAWLTFFIICNVLTAIFVWLNFSEQVSNVSTLRTKYFDSKGDKVYKQAGSNSHLSWLNRVEAVKMFFLHYQDWYRRKYDLDSGGRYCNV